MGIIVVVDEDDHQTLASLHERLLEYHTAAPAEATEVAGSSLRSATEARRHDEGPTNDGDDVIDVYDEGSSSRNPLSRTEDRQSEAAMIPLDAQDTSSSVCCCNVSVLLLSAGYWLVFSAFNAVNGYVTSVLPGTLGNQSLLISSIAYVTAAPLMPLLQLPDTHLIILGNFLHFLYICALFFGSSFPLALLLISAISGLGGSMAWLGHGLFLTRVSPAGQHKFTVGLFWGIYYTSGVAGNVISSAAFFTFDFSGLLLIFCGMSLVGVAVLCCLPLLSPSHHGVDGAATENLLHPSMGSESQSHLQGDDCEPIQPTASDHSKAANDGHEDSQVDLTIPLVSSERRDENHKEATSTSQISLLHPGHQSPPFLFSLLAPIMACQGLCQAFWCASFPRLLPPSVIGPAMFSASCGQVLGSFGFNWLAQMLDLLCPTLLAGACCFFFADAIVIAKLLHPPANAPLSLFPALQTLTSLHASLVAAFLFGLSSGVLTSHNYAMLGQAFNADNSFVWAAYTLINTVGQTVGYGLGIITPLQGSTASMFQIKFHGCLLALGVTGFVLVEMKLLRFKLTPR